MNGTLDQLEVIAKILSKSHLYLPHKRKKNVVTFGKVLDKYDARIKRSNAFDLMHS